jgi:sortase A
VAGEHVDVRRGLLIVPLAGVVALGIAVSVLNRPPASPVAASRTVFTTPLTTARSSPSLAPSAAATPPPAPAVQPNVAAAVAPAAPPGVISARISIPRIGIRNAPIYDRGTDARGTMLIAPGYAVTRYAFSAPFAAGNTVLYGHDDIQGNIFGHLYDLRPGDTILISVGGVSQTYRVTGHQIVPPTAVSVLAPTPDVRLTLITCWPFNVDTKRWIVTAVEA